ncbi:MAG: two-component sensor histidine kinase [Bacteroidetes bacterium]|nr:two-component sensor histidine kinase [Bacteroidota bacterium]
MDKKKSDELLIATRELAFQYEEKAKRAGELLIANEEFQKQGEALRKSHELFLTLFEYNHAGISVSRISDGVLLNVNDAFVRLFGFADKEDIVGRASRDVIQHLDVRQMERAFLDMKKNGPGKEFEMNVRTQGAELWVSISLMEVEIEDIPCCLSAFIDITRRKKVEDELKATNQKMLLQNEEKEKRTAERLIAIRELSFQNAEKEKRAEERIIARRELTFQNEEKEKRAAELVIANRELIFQNTEKEKRAAELIIANRELAFQNEEKEKRAAELIIANRELVFQSEEKGKRAAELIIANRELIFQNEEKEKRAAELTIANRELAFQNEDKEKRAAELIIANRELIFQNEEKEKRADELVIANRELAFQNEEKEKRAAELIIANRELAFQSEEKGKRAAELIIANRELAFQSEEKGKRANELIIANRELSYQNEEKEKRAHELIIANVELEQFAYVASHDLQEPLRTVSNYMKVFEEDYLNIFDDNARKYLKAVNESVERMSLLIKSLLDFSRLGSNKQVISVDCGHMVSNVIADLNKMIKTSGAVIEIGELPILNVYKTQIRQVFQNLITNAIKFQKEGVQPRIQILAEQADGAWKFSVSDNGIGISSDHFEKVFDIFQRLRTDRTYEGNGIGLANCKKIIQLHQGEIWIESVLGHGTTFYFTISNMTP